MDDVLFASDQLEIGNESPRLFGEVGHLVPQVPANPLPAAGDIPTLRLDVTVDPREDVPQLAGRIIGELLRQLQRVP